MSKFSQKGLSLFLAVVILAIILAIVLGLSLILVGQIKMIRGMERSVIAIFAADTGVEKVLKIVLEHLKGGAPPDDYYPETSLGEASYEVEVKCCSSGDEKCDFFDPLKNCDVEDTDSRSDEDSECKATRYCIRSIGQYKGVKRAIEVKIYPQPEE